MSLVLRFAAGSHKGMIREGNEDSGYAGPRLLAVADGMGGQAAGEVASSEVLSSIVDLDEDVPGTDPMTALRDAADRANERLRVLVEADPSLEGMGTTLTALLWTGQSAAMIHIGDSRAYLLRDGSLTQITTDHTWVQRLVDEGRITEEEASTHPQRSLIMRALMGTGEVESDLSIRDVRAGDRYLLCSDGLSGVVSHQTIEETLGSYYSPEDTIAELIQLALRGGGPDNITCVVADVLEVDDADPAATHFDHAPMVVGAVADGPPTVAHPTVANTPASRAASLGRKPEQGEQPEGAAEDGDAEGGYQEYDEFEGGFDDDYEPDTRRGRRRAKERKRRGWVLPTSLAVALVVLLGGGAYFGYQWTQTQYYVGANGDHVAIYKGVSQNLAGLKLSSVYADQPQVALKYLPPYEQTNLKDSISASSLSDAQDRVNQLAHQAQVCQIVAQQKSTPVTSPTPKPTPKSTVKPDATSKATPRPSSSPSTSPSPSPSPTLSTADQTLAQQCVTS
ncbi:PP2C family protein-serine/threonine phosphatase [Streptacidiphilus fuscans]|uniref:Serine/threonine protein phosphatase PstP n=1 Tax=Streptacidiphilus fuscans TaxID=2789292 RepID=A0A931B0W6_9ACTN|nr:PP2C family serine/threonine-protein phosphatase [Streptacidiphilus fuscans]MBF9068203.1 protein phosphatase 2C domain-containing protein [Streptacidiphilus fuscans]